MDQRTGHGADNLSGSGPRHTGYAAHDDTLEL
jgi:hypothetical protein